jgi:hypothetical protein
MKLEDYKTKNKPPKEERLKWKIKSTNPLSKSQQHKPNSRKSMRTT